MDRIWGNRANGNDILGLARWEPSGRLQNALDATHLDNGKFRILGHDAAEVVRCIPVESFIEGVTSGCRGRTNLNTVFPTPSTFHALTNATSPAMACSSTYLRPLNSRCSLAIPGILTPLDAPPSW